MASVNIQKKLACEFVKNVANGGIDKKYYSHNLSVWSPLMGTITKDEYMPRLEVVKKVWKDPLQVEIDTVTAQPGRIAVQARSRGILYNGEIYSNEYIFLIEFNEDDQITHIREYFNMDQVRNILQPAVYKWREMHNIPAP